jgi:hypothetical protein
MSPFTKDLITSTHPKFHAMVVNGQPKTQNPNENRVAQKWIKNFILKSIHPQRLLQKSIAIGRLKKIQLPFDNS